MNEGMLLQEGQGAREAVRRCTSLFFHYPYSCARLSSAALPRNRELEAWGPVPNGFSYPRELLVS